MTAKKLAYLDDTDKMPPELLPGVPVVRAFPFAFDTAGLAAGVAFHTPAVGDVILNAWIEITTGFDGTTPKADVGTFVDTTDFGWLGWDASGPVSVDAASNHLMGSGLVPQVGASDVYYNTGGGLPARVTDANPVKIVVSQDGKAGGAATGATQGAGVVYLVTATPLAV